MKKYILDKAITHKRRNIMHSTSPAEMKAKLLSLQENKLRKQYPDEDAWRAPRNIADSMGCVGMAMNQLQNYASMLENLPTDQLKKLYETAVCE